jgi:hypothetical protein
MTAKRTKKNGSSAAKSHCSSAEHAQFWRMCGEGVATTATVVQFSPPWVCGGCGKKVTAPCTEVTAQRDVGAVHHSPIGGNISTIWSPRWLWPMGTGRVCHSAMVSRNAKSGHHTGPCSHRDHACITMHCMQQARALRNCHPFTGHCSPICVASVNHLPRHTSARRGQCTS